MHVYVYMSRLMTKPTNSPVRPAKTQISLGIRPIWPESSLSPMKNALIFSYQLSAQWRLIRLCGRPRCSESSLGAKIILLVLSWGGSYFNNQWDWKTRNATLTFSCMFQKGRFLVLMMLIWVRFFSITQRYVMTVKCQSKLCFKLRNLVV